VPGDNRCIKRHVEKFNFIDSAVEVVPGTADVGVVHAARARQLADGIIIRMSAL
jgi:hypothetical protein